MYALATCTASILRGTSTDSYMDVIDTDTVVASGVLCAIREVTSRVYDQASEAPRVVRGMRAQLPSDTDVRLEDRLRDDTHQVTYMIENVSVIGGVGYTADLELELKRVT